MDRESKEGFGGSKGKWMDRIGGGRWKAPWIDPPLLPPGSPWR